MTHEPSAAPEQAEEIAELAHFSIYEDGPRRIVLVDDRNDATAEVFESWQLALAAILQKAGFADLMRETARRLSAAEARERRLAEFVHWALSDGSWQGLDLDGASVQDKAESLGLIVKVKYDPDIHGPNDHDIEAGDDWYVMSDIVTASSPHVPPPEPERSTAVASGLKERLRACAERYFTAWGRDNENGRFFAACADRIEELEEALRPFAVMATTRLARKPETEVVLGSAEFAGKNYREITVGDLRRAAKLVEGGVECE